MDEILCGLSISGEHKHWHLHVLANEKHLDELRADGFDIDPIVGIVPGLSAVDSMVDDLIIDIGNRKDD